MTNIEVLKRFNKIVKPYLKAHPSMELTDILFYADADSEERVGVPLVARNDFDFLLTLEEYIKEKK